MAAKKSASTETVIVGCSLPHGLQIHLPESQERYKLNGCNTAVVVGGYGRTAIPADFAAKWFAANASVPYVKNGAVFLAQDEASFADQATEQADESDGFEALNADKPVTGVTKVDNKE